MKMDPVRYKKQYKWSKPPTSWAKLNVDGSCRLLENIGTFGCVLRDDKGAWLWGFSGRIDAPTVNDTELRSLVQGLEMAWERRIQRLVVETDSEMVFAWVTELDPPLNEYSSIVDRCKELLHMPWDIEFKKIDRKTNMCADHVASLGYHLDGNGKLWLSPPTSVIPILSSDLGY